MERRTVFSLLIAFGFAVTVSAGNAEAFVFHRLRTRRPAYSQPVRRTLHGSYATHARKASATWSWDVPLDVRMWRWPPYYQR